MNNCSLPKGDKKKRKEIPVLLRCHWRCYRKTRSADLSSQHRQTQEEKAAPLKGRHGRKGITHCTLGGEVAWKATDAEE